MVVLTEGKTTPFYAKTAMSLLRYRGENVLALLDSSEAGKTAGELLGMGGDIPVAATLDDVESPDSLVLGIAPPGGQIPPEWKSVIVEAIERGLDYLVRTAMPGSGGGPGHAHFYYGHYYAVQAMYLAGGEWWSRWWPAMRSELIRRQASSGGWVDHQIGSAYATAMSLIILQMPKRYLPIFQK